MTVTEPRPTTTAVRRRRRPWGTPAWTITMRWVALIATTAVAFWRTLAALATEIGAQTLIVIVPVVVLLAGMAAAGTALRRHDEPPIYDRQTDVIVGGIVLFIALAVEVMVNPRYSQAYLTVHMDLLSMWLFVLGAAILLFGLRPVSRYRWAWLVLLMIWPIPLRVLILSVGRGALGAAFLMVLIAAAATAVATGRTVRRGLIGAGLAALVGSLAIVTMYVVLDIRRLVLVATIPALLCAAVAFSVMYVDYRRRPGRSWSPMGRPLLDPTLRRVGRPALLLVSATVLTAFVPLPQVGTWPSATIPGMAIGKPLVVPAGWRQASEQRYEWVRRLYGTTSVLYRQLLVQKVGSTAFDKDARTRRVMVDSVDAARPLALEVYPYIFRYNLVGDRFGPAVEVPLPHGVRSWVWSVVDDERYLTYTVLSWWWNNGARTQQIILWAVDNHEPDAQFPPPRITIGQNLNTMMTVFFRGNASIADTDPAYKDRGLLTLLATELVNAQVERAGGGA
ncbi:hypothetical protein [Gordonia sp. NB41Y]|uniref:hypothetical protein n=1 Tax=Gordonia sp. NB41Y TaxID=875808 RepID=UPI0006B17D94|nr:hypothetical protein [Gordonia sp. NB41Y]EMP14634.2 hypothetical protein ISGA_3089 [Gordonia sp. NB41Y]WLP92256.1 hypothetical protein Q9K23_08535 [Gordonia sp. NB41Y]